MNKKLYVGNLNYTTTDEELRNLFSQVGTVVSAAVITDRMTGRSKGFGFVEMETDKGAQDAIERFNNYELGQRNITVNEARPPRERTSFSGGGDRGSRGGGYGGGGGRGNSGGGGRGGFGGDRGDRGDRGGSSSGGNRRRF
jgi:RNA recognition motif-containing protein